MRLTSCIFFLLVIACRPNHVLAGETPRHDTVRINQYRLIKKLSGLSVWFQNSGRAINSNQISSLPYSDLVPDISPRSCQKDIYLRFTVTNQADSLVKFYFHPGMYFSTLELYRLNQPGDNVELLQVFSDETEGFKKMELESKQTIVYFAKLKFAKTNTRVLTPILIRDYYLKAYIVYHQNTERRFNTITFVLSGMLLMMILYSIAVFILNRNIEFLYYAGFACCMGLMFFIKSYLFRVPSNFSILFEGYLDFVLQSLGTFVYLSFLRKFIDTKKNFAWLHKMMLFEQFFIVISIFVFSYLYFKTTSYNWLTNVENLSKYIWILGAVIFVIYSFKKNIKLLNYLAVGHSVLLICGLASMLMISFPSIFKNYLPPYLNNALLFYEIGLVTELMFFLTALAFKNKAGIEDQTKERERLKLRTEMQDFEKQLAILSAQQDERNRISADMHDELGSGATHIKLMSDIIKAKMKDDVLPEIDKISKSANELINKMDTLIWTMKSENDSIDSLITYIRFYALEFFEITSIECRVQTPATFPVIEISGGKRRNLFLAVKETLNNVLKHSKASQVVISFDIGNKLLITITDDGIGIDFNNLRQFGSGLNNIQKRIESIDGTYKIENNEGGGARTIFEIKL